MDYKSKKIIIAVLVGIMLAVNIGVIYLQSIGKVEIQVLEVEGMENALEISKDVLVALQVVVCICNLIILFILNRILEHKALAIKL